VERFFSESSKIDKIVEVEELLLKRYSNIDYILNLDYKSGIEFIKNAYKKESEEMLYKQWLVDYKRMTKDNFISFKDYKDKVFKTENKVQNLNKEQISDKVRSIIELTL